MKNKNSEIFRFYKKCEELVKRIILDYLPENVKVYFHGKKEEHSHSDVLGRHSDFAFTIHPPDEFDFDKRLIHDIKDIIEESYVPYNVNIVNLNEMEDGYMEKLFEKEKVMVLR